MANDSFSDIARKLVLRCPLAPLTLAQDWVRNAFRDIVEYRRWSWLFKYGQIVIPAAYTTGLASISFGGTQVTLTGGTTDPSWVGRQFRVSATSPILTIVSVDEESTTTFELDPATPWPQASVTDVSYSVYQAYYSMPGDFHAFMSITSQQYAWKTAFLGVNKSDLDAVDPQRSASGTPPRVIVPFDYYNGSPRWELWPHQYGAGYLAMTYESRPTDAFDGGATVPALLPSDIILERALMYCARWPGSARETPNPYYSEPLAKFHEEQYLRRLGLIIKQDDEHMPQDVRYANTGIGIPSAAWAQMHDVGWAGRY